MLKLIPKLSTIHLKTIQTMIRETLEMMIWETLKNIIPNTPNFQILATILEPVVWHFAAVAHLFCDLFFGPSGAGCNPLGPIFFVFLKKYKAFVLQMSKTPEQQMASTTPSKNKQGFKKTIPKIDPNKSFSLFLFNKAA